MKSSWIVKEIVGFDVYTKDSKFLGQLFDVLPTRANDIFVVRKDETEMLIPALKSVVIDIDEVEKKIVVELPHGLEDVFLTHQSQKP